METVTININNLKVGSKLLSMRTEQVFTVVRTDNSGKVDIVSEQGTEKSLSRSTLKRWYTQIVAQEEPEQELHPQYVAALEGEPEPEDSVEEVGEVVEDAVERVEDVAEELEEVVPPIQPAIPTTATRRAPNAQQVDPVIEALRQRIIDEVLSVCPNAVQRETNSYTGMKVGKYNFAEIYKGKRRFTIRVIGKALTEQQASMCSIAPKSYGWTLDATFTVLVEDDFQTAVDILKASYAYRFNNTPQRGKKAN